MCSLTRVAGYGATYKDDYDNLIGNKSDQTRMTHLLGSCIMIALLIIGITAAAHAFPSHTTGWTALGLGVGYAGAKLLGGSFATRKVDWISGLCLAALIITFGALGASGVLTSAQLGIALIGVATLSGTIAIGMMVYAYHKRISTQPHISSDQPPPGPAPTLA